MEERGRGMVRAARVALVVAGGAAPLGVLALIAAYGVPVPTWDQWELVPLLEKFHTGELSFADFWKQHNEHRLVAPLALMVTLAVLSGWNIHWEFTASFLVACGTFALLAGMLRATFGGRAPTWLLASCSLIVFALAQHQNWLWGWQWQWVLCVFGSVLAAWALQRWPGRARGMLVASGGALLASFSLSSGLLVWAAVLPQLGLRRVRSTPLVACWCGAGLLVFASYFHGFEAPPGHPPWSAFLARPLASLRYIATYLGLPLGAFDPVFAPLAGLATVGAFALSAASVVRRSRSDFERLLPWCTLALFALLSATVTGVGRVGFGAEQALTSRYATIAGLLLLATVVALALLWEQRARTAESVSRGSRLLVVLLATLALIGQLATARASLSAAAARCALLTQARTEWLAYPRTSREAFGVLYPIERISLTRERSGILRDLGYLLPPEADAPKDRKAARRRRAAAAEDVPHLPEAR